MKSYVCSRVFFSLNVLPHGPFQTFSPMRVSLLGTEGQLEGVQTEGVFDLNGKITSQATATISKLRPAEVDRGHKIWEKCTSLL